MGNFNQARTAAPSDTDLLTRIATGDREAFGTLYDRYVRTIFRYAVVRGLLLPDAEEVTQDVFVTAYRRASAVRVIDTSALPWLTVTCRNLIRARHRQLLKSRAVELDDAALGRDRPSGAWPENRPGNHPTHTRVLDEQP